MLNPMLILSSCIVRCSKRHGGRGAAQMSIRRSRAALPAYLLIFRERNCAKRY
jgi:hypothetical protein